MCGKSISDINSEEAGTKEVVFDSGMVSRGKKNGRDQLPESF